MFNKRASLEISIQAIVIIVLAMTLLGLGLGFIRGLFGKVGEIGGDVTDQVKNKVLEDLISGDKKVAFPKTQIELGKGESTILTVGVRNKKDSTLSYKLRFTPVSFIPASGTQGGTFQIENPQWFQTAQPPNGYKLASAEADVKNLRLKIPTATPAGSYVLNFEVTDESVGVADPDYIYAQKDFFIVVKG
ncbi:hypothetical protein J4204_02085 [Candidatus Woesearchaeota archaeon]|nr:hypothetical protein [Candidatus Woesearchaeota archaeon]